MVFLLRPILAALGLGLILKGSNDGSNSTGTPFLHNAEHVLEGRLQLIYRHLDY